MLRAAGYDQDEELRASCAQRSDAGNYLVHIILVGEEDDRVRGRRHDASVAQIPGRVQKKPGPAQLSLETLNRLQVVGDDRDIHSGNYPQLLGQEAIERMICGAEADSERRRNVASGRVRVERAKS